VVEIGSAERTLSSAPEPVLATGNVEKVFLIARVDYDSIVYPYLTEYLQTDGAARKFLGFFLIFVWVGAKISDNELREEWLELPQPLEFNFFLLCPLYPANFSWSDTRDSFSRRLWGTCDLSRLSGAALKIVISLVPSDGESFPEFSVGWSVLISIFLGRSIHLLLLISFEAHDALYEVSIFFLIRAFIVHHLVLVPLLTPFPYK